MKMVQLKEICDLKNGFAFKSGDYIEYSNTLNCRMSNIKPNGQFDIEYAPKYLPDSYVEKYSEYLLKDGDIVIAMTDLANNPKILGIPTMVKSNGKNLLLNQRVGKLVFKEVDKISISYLTYALNRKIVKDYYTKFAGGGLQLNVAKKDILNVQIPLPPLSTQKRIAEILDAADAYRQKTKALLEKYDALAQSLFLEMFGDSLNNPKGWEVKKLKELSNKINSGNTPKGGSKVYVNDGITFLRSQNVWRNRLELDDVVYIDKETHAKMDKSSLKNKDILMTKTGRINTENSSLGRAAIYLGEDDCANINGHVYLIRLKPAVTPEFILYILTSKEYIGYIRSVCVGGIDKRQINKNHLEDFPIINPPKEMQLKFVSELKAIEKHKIIIKECLEKAENLFQSLLQRAFKGELD